MIDLGKVGWFLLWTGPAVAWAVRRAVRDSREPASLRSRRWRAVGSVLRLCEDIDESGAPRGQYTHLPFAIVTGIAKTIVPDPDSEAEAPVQLRAPISGRECLAYRIALVWTDGDLVAEYGNLGETTASVPFRVSDRAVELAGGFRCPAVLAAGRMLWPFEQLSEETRDRLRASLRPDFGRDLGTRYMPKGELYVCESVLCAGDRCTVAIGRKDPKYPNRPPRAQLWIGAPAAVAAAVYAAVNAMRERSTSFANEEALNRMATYFVYVAIAFVAVVILAS